MKWKEMSKMECQQIVEALQERHGAYLKEDEWFEVSGRRSPQEVQITMTLRNRDESLYYPVEGKIDVEANRLTGPIAAQFLLLDFQDNYFYRFLREERDVYLPIDWAEFQSDQYQLYARGQIFNRRLETLADHWLAGDQEIVHQALSRQK